MHYLHAMVRVFDLETPDQISIELLQKDKSLNPQEPWISIPNSGEW